MSKNGKLYLVRCFSVAVGISNLKDSQMISFSPVGGRQLRSYVLLEGERYEKIFIFQAQHTSHQSQQYSSSTENMCEGYSFFMLSPANFM